eukprot:TRINITY_DN42884_c0_g1_i1.p1 TRINITY_DN42884_c0_g1~~TRINITY_DN42884_c0_g1_i1.p1  ORF type:complete len:460 (+),score=93.30 TRINITY_DN42884_c0_g1_i1:145-1524(+)
MQLVWQVSLAAYLCILAIPVWPSAAAKMSAGRKGQSGRTAELQGFEETFRALAAQGSAPVTEDLLEKFISDFLNSTAVQMKKAVRDDLLAARAQLRARRRGFTPCEEQLKTGLQVSATMRQRLTELKADLKRCVDNFTSLPDDDDRQRHPDNPYVTGDWPESFTGGGGWSSCESLTSMTCSKRDSLCGEWVPFASLQAVNSAPDPDTRKCDDQSDDTVGEYLFRMWHYWRNLSAVHDMLQSDCQLWCDWCDSNQSQCPVEPSPGDGNCPERPKPNTSTPCDTGSTTTAPSPTQTCRSSQNYMDSQACEQAELRNAACNAYNSCYTSVRDRFSALHADFCDAGGQAAELHDQYFSILRLECMLKGYNGSHEGGWHYAGWADCDSAQAQDELSFFHIYECHEALPAYKVYEECQAATSPHSDSDMPGTSKYKEHFYSGIKFPAPCAATCCRQQPEAITLVE